MAIDPGWLKKELDRANIAYVEDEERIGDKVYVGLRITGDFMNLPKEVRHRLYAESKPEDWPEKRDYVEEMEKAHDTNHLHQGV